MSETRINTEAKFVGKTVESKKKNWIKGKAARIGIPIGLSVLALGGAYAADHYGLINIPGIHKNIEIPSSYYTLKVGTDTEYITNEELARLQDSITLPTSPTGTNGLPTLPQFTLLTPFLLKDGDQISMSQTYLGPGVNSAGKEVEPRYAGTIRFIVPTKNTEMIVGIVDSKATSMELFKNKPLTLGDQQYFGGVKIRVTRQDGSQYQVSYYSTEDVRSLAPNSVVENAPQANSDYQSWLSQKGLPVTAITPIMTTNIDYARINAVISRISSSNSVNDLFFSEIKFFQSSNGKLLLPPQQ